MQDDQTGRGHYPFTENDKSSKCQVVEAERVRERRAMRSLYSIATSLATSFFLADRSSLLSR